MDDLFAAFDAPAPAAAPAPVAVASAAGAGAGKAGAASSAASSSAPSHKLPATAGQKRPRVEEEPSAAAADAEAGGSAADVQEVTWARAGGKKKEGDMISAIDAAATMDLDAKRNERVEEFVAIYHAGPQEEAGGAAASAADPSHRSESSEGGGAASSSGGAAPLPGGRIIEGMTTAPESNPSDDGLILGKKPAKAYPFKLDPFQLRSIECLERDESVLVSAHTSAGKTVVAEYAIAMALRDKQRVIYTSPIKALSNQKYRDLYETFSDVGLMTGDVTINPNASCLVMTTEILRSMLYRGSEVIREVKWVIFDEIHYMRDRERGVVWEESIIMLPHKVRFVFLSATIPNSKEFAEWVAKIHHQTCHVVYTDYRPTPLQHFIYPSGGEGVFLVVDEKGRFREDNFTKAMAVLNTSSLEDAVNDVVSKGGGKKNTSKSMGRGQGGPSDLFRIIKMVMDKNYDPVIVFSFSKKECEQNALQISKMDLTTPDEKKLIETVFVNAIDSLNEDDKKLPQIEAILPLLKRGIGIHHGGLLPIVKEVIEILFQESLLKILFATETFAMGINMPARTVVFTASRKFDGTNFRFISPGEYIQMSGRAGRRGLDDRGVVIQMVDEKMEPAAAKEILKGTADPLNSAFHLGYNMLLNLTRAEDTDPEKLMESSFHQFQATRALPEMKAELARLERERDAIVVPDEAAVAEYHGLATAAEEASARIARVVARPEYMKPVLNPGRLVRVQDGEDDWGWGIVVNFKERRANDLKGGILGIDADGRPCAAATEGAKVVPGGIMYVVADVAVRSVEVPVPKPAGAAGAAAKGAKVAAATVVRPLSSVAPDSLHARDAQLRVVSVLLPLITAVSSIRLYMPASIKDDGPGGAMLMRLGEALKRFPTMPLMDPIKELRVDAEGFPELLAQSKDLASKLAACPLASAADKEARLAAYRSKLDLADSCRFLSRKIQESKQLVMKATLKKMRSVLRRLEHVNAENVVLTKGRIACEINTADELLCTELIFNGAFMELDAAQTAAVLSTLVASEASSSDNPPPLPEHLAGPFRAVQAAARRIAAVSRECGIEDMDEEEYVASFKPEMMELVYAWVNGAKFVDICGMTRQFEGSIVRVIRRLEELTRQLADAAKAINNAALEAKFREASTKMRRDIIFAASLFL